MPRAEVHPDEKRPGLQVDHNDGQALRSPLLRGSTYHRSAGELLAAYRRHCDTLNVGNLQSEQSFSWTNCLVSLFTYALILSDVLRTGLAIKTVPYPTVEPDTYSFFGPYAYITNHLTLANATTTDTTRFWAYKYDTTSVAMRSVAQHLGLEPWPACVLYREHCSESRGIPLANIFLMIDSLVEGVSKHEGIHASRQTDSRSRGILTLRIEIEYKDRVHHYALPWFFERNTIHTSQAIHFTYNASQPVASICSDPFSARRPYSCTQNWTNFRRVGCSKSATEDPAVCQSDAPRLWDLIPKRLAHLAAHYPGHTIDYAVLDSMDDYKRGGISFQGRKTGVDVVLFSRIRKCDSNSGACSTVAVDDYRYEAATFIMSAPGWFFPVAILRGVAQTYVWLRLGMLIAGSYAAHRCEQRFRNATLRSRVTTMLRTVFLIPSQVVIYGCSFPISMYLLAHLIDSPATYELVAAYFTTILGQTNWSITSIIKQCSISMRTIWIVGFTCHRLVALATRSSCSPTHGITGASEFAITFIASLTIFAQYRSLSFRRLRILQLYEIPPSARRAQRFADAVNSSRSTINNLLGGSTVDAQCLLCGFLGLLFMSIVMWAINRTFPKYVPVRLTLVSTTIAPYSAGTLWSRNRLVVSWYGSVLNFDHQNPKREIKPASPTFEDPSSSPDRQAAFDSLKLGLYREFMDAPNRAIVLRDNTISRLFQRNMYTVDKRTREIEAAVFLINLAVMTDLFSFFSLRVADGRLVGLYQSKATQRCFLLPYELMGSDADIPIDWDELTLVAVVNSRDMEWTDLLRCG